MSGRTASTRGRRPGGPDTRGEILEAARRAFAERGFQGTSMRAVATAAGVDAALVHHYFGSKGDLFLAAAGLPVDPRDLLGAVFADGTAGAGERLLSHDDGGLGPTRDAGPARRPGAGRARGRPGRRDAAARRHRTAGRGHGPRAPAARGGRRPGAARGDPGRRSRRGALRAAVRAGRDAAGGGGGGPGGPDAAALPRRPPDRPRRPTPPDPSRPRSANTSGQPRGTGAGWDPCRPGRSSSSGARRSSAAPR